MVFGLTNSEALAVADAVFNTTPLVMDDDDEADPRTFIPTPEQIAAGCAEIRSGWSRATLEDRCGVKYIPWTVHQVRRSRRPL
jgi:hypothetical protein